MSFERRVLEAKFDQMDFSLEKKYGHYYAVNGKEKIDINRFVSTHLKNFAHMTEEEFAEESLGIQFEAEMECMVKTSKDRGVREIDGHTRDMSTEDISEENLLALHFQILNTDSVIVEKQEIDVNNLEKGEKRFFEWFISGLQD